MIVKLLHQASLALGKGCNTSLISVNLSKAYSFVNALTCLALQSFAHLYLKYVRLCKYQLLYNLSQTFQTAIKIIQQLYM